MLVRILRNAIVAHRGVERQFLAGREVEVDAETAGRLARVGAIGPVPGEPPHVSRSRAAASLIRSVAPELEIDAEVAPRPATRRRRAT